MTLNEIKQKFLEIISRQNNLKGRILDDFTEVTELYVEIFGEFPKCYFADCNPDKKATVEKITDKIECFLPGHYDYYIIKEGKLEFDQVMYDNNILTEQGIITIERDGITVYTLSEEFKDLIFSCYVQVEEEVPCEVYWVSNGQNGFSATKLNIKSALFDASIHYNDDFELNKVEDFVNGDSSGLVILHGKPGTGKTYLIRHLSQKYPNKKIYLMDKSTFAYIGNDSFVNFLLSNSVKDSVFVLEDCETLLSDRIRNHNDLLTTVLNLSDGILGDGLKIKFICTFNADLTSIDAALLRKGRLKYKYEFTALSSEKTQILAKHLGKNIPEGKSLTVSEIYNWEEDNKGSQLKQSKKIGFV